MTRKHDRARVMLVILGYALLLFGLGFLVGREHANDDWRNQLYDRTTERDLCITALTEEMNEQD